MPLISLFKKGEGNNDKTVLYRTYHRKNPLYLEKYTDSENYPFLGEVDDNSPTIFQGDYMVCGLIAEISSLVSDAENNADSDICNHLKEILVLCKLCVWSNEFWLEFSPFGVPIELYPNNMPESYKFSLPDEL